MSKLTSLFAAGALLCAATAECAERRVVAEMFTATWCGPCVSVGTAMIHLMEDYPESYFALMVHQADAFEIPWGDDRAAFYNVPGYPTVWTDGMIPKVGGGGNWQGQYAVLEGHMNQRLDVPTDVNVDVGAEPDGPMTYRTDGRISIDADGEPRTLYVHVGRGLWNAPNSDHYTYSLRDVVTFTIDLEPGESTVVSKRFHYGEDWDRHDESAMLFVVQDVTGSAPANVHNSGWDIWPFEPLPEEVDCLDIDGSGDVGFGDLLIMLADWGPCAGCDADLDGNGSVEFTDLLALLAAWGSCP